MSLDDAVKRLAAEREASALEAAERDRRSTSLIPEFLVKVRTLGLGPKTFEFRDGRARGWAIVPMQWRQRGGEYYGWDPGYIVTEDGRLLQYTAADDDGTNLVAGEYGVLWPWLEGAMARYIVDRGGR